MIRNEAAQSLSEAITLVLHHQLAANLPVVFMTYIAGFGDLPVELGEYILLFAKDLYALYDKSTLANLSRVSRAIHAIVQPAIAETVSIDCSNVSRVCATSSAFTVTRCLVVSSELDEAQKDHLGAILASTPAFGKLEMFSGSLSTLYDVLNVCSPTRVIVASLPDPFRGTRLSHEQIQHLCRVTHLRGKGSDRLLRDLASSCGGESSLRSSLANISHVVLHVDDVFVWHSIIELLPQLLTLPKVERVCLRVAPDVKGIRFATISFARAMLSDDAAARLWMDFGTIVEDDSVRATDNNTLRSLTHTGAWASRCDRMLRSRTRAWRRCDAVTWKQQQISMCLLLGSACSPSPHSWRL